MMTALIVATVGILIIGLLYWQRSEKMRKISVAQLALDQAEAKAKMILATATLDAKEIVMKAQGSAHQLREDVAKQERLVQSKEEALSREKTTLNQKLQELQKKEKLVDAREQELKTKSQLTEEEAKAQIWAQVEKDSERECQLYLLHKRQEYEAQAEVAAHQLVVTALSRLPKKALKDATVTSITLPNEEIKAKIIGREGKNIKAFQQLTGVTVVIDETPQTLILSCFDPQRREVAKIALEALIDDGRFSVERIEEEVQLAQKKLQENLLKYGQEAALTCNVHGLHPSLLVTLGKLHLRSSFGQNLLEHSVEVANIMGLLAAELKLSVPKAIRMGLLHDIGKALDSDTSHALAGYRLCLDAGEPEEIANGVGCHHNEMPAATLEASLVKCADYLSGARLGARAENNDGFMKRLRDFESHALGFDGVKAAFAVAAGRELQVFVRPEVIDEAGAVDLARMIAKKIQGLSPSSRVQVSVIRETKAIEYSI